jgi:L-iditol 2-dehydrogenase
MEVQALLITAPRQVSQKRLAVPEPSADDFVVRVEFCGLCTPEQRVFRGAKSTYPYWGGHELAGIVESGPRSSKAASVGERVAVLLMRRCGACAACRKGLDNHCAYLHPETRAGLPIGPGGLVDRIVVPMYQVFRVPHELPAPRAAMVEPVACVLRSIERARPNPHERAAVLGGGTMGLLHATLLALRGCHVFLFEDDNTTYNAAAAAGVMGCDALSALEDAEKVAFWTDGWGFDVVVCTRFGVRAVRLALAAAARGGRVILYQSIPVDDEVQFGANFLHYRELEIIGTIAQTSADIDKAVALITQRQNLIDVLQTQIFPASRCREAFEAATSPQLNRVLLDMRPPYGA